MRAFRPLSFALVALAALGLAACGSDPQTTPDAGEPQVDVVKYFGLQVGRCYEYTTKDTVQTSTDLAVVTTRTVSDYKTTVYEVHYRDGSGGDSMIDLFSVSGNNLLLHNRRFANGSSYEYDPAIIFAHAPAAAGDRVDSSGTCAIHDNDGVLKPDPPETHTMRVDVVAAPGTRVPASATPIDAVMFAFNEDPLRGPKAEVRTLVPGSDDTTAITGWLTLENNFTSDENHNRTIFKLQKIRDLGTDPLQIGKCGVSP